MIEQDISRIAAALERIAETNALVADMAMLAYQPQIVSRTDQSAQQPEQEPQEFVKPKAGPGRGHKKPKPDAVQNVDTTPENPTQADTTAPAAEVPDTVPETDTSPASPSEPAPESPAPVIPEVTLEDVSRAVVEMAKVKTRDEIMAVWKPFGISRGSELKPDQFFDALMAIKEAMRA